MDNFHDLQKSIHPKDRMSHDFLILLLEQLFGKSDNIRVDMDIETEENHAIVKSHWKTIREYYGVPDSVKYVQKCVRQTLMQIVNRLNQKYQFTHQLKFEHKRHDYYDKEQKKKITERWNLMTLI